MSVLNRPMFMKKGGEAFPDLSGDGKVTRKDVLMGRGVIPQNKNRGGLMRHDERTIRNVDDELYRIAPKTHDRGRERIDAREEYGRDLREKDYLRAQMNRLANGGQPMPMMPPPMPMAPPPEAQVQMTEDAAAQQGEMLGAEYVDQMMTGIDSADSTEELIDAIRGNDKTLQDRYDELANFVGERDASATPESVLTLVQPTIMMTEQGAMDSGIGELMQGITGEVEMETEMGAPTPMGQGVGELMMAESVEEVIPEMNQGGPVPVQHFQDGMEVTFPGAGATGGKGDQTYMDLINQAAMLGYQQGLGMPAADRIGASMEAYRPLYEQFLGFTDQDRDLAKSQVYFDIASRGLALAGGVNPDTGQPMTGGTLSQIAQAAQTAPRVMAQVGAQQRAAERAVNQAALGQAITDETMERQARLAQELERYKFGLGGRPRDLVEIINKESGEQVAVLDARDARFMEQLSPYTNDQGSFDSTKFALFNVRGQPTSQFAEPYRSARAQDDATRVGTLIDQASTARDQNATIGLMKPMIEEAGFITGEFSDLRRFLGRVANLAGYDASSIPLIGDPGAASAFESLANRFALDTIGELQGVRGTNVALDMIKNAGPRLGATPQGNALLLELKEKLNKRTIDIGEIAQVYDAIGPSNIFETDKIVLENLNLKGLNLNDAIRAYDELKPVIGEDFFANRPEDERLVEMSLAENDSAFIEKFREQLNDVNFDPNTITDPIERMQYYAAETLLGRRRQEAQRIDSSSRVVDRPIFQGAP